jgi:hypothetical protein
MRFQTRQSVPKHVKFKNVRAVKDFQISICHDLRRILKSQFYENVRYNPRRTLKGFQISCRKSESNGKIPTLKNGAFNRGRSSTLYEYVEPRNVTEF